MTGEFVDADLTTASHFDDGFIHLARFRTMYTRHTVVLKHLSHQT